MAVDNTENVINLKGHVSIPFSFGIDGDGNYGYYGADGSLIPFKNVELQTGSQSGSQRQGETTYTITFDKPFSKAPRAGVNTTSYGFHIHSVSTTATTLTFVMLMSTTGTRDYSFSWFAVVTD